MVGPCDSVIGQQKENIIKRYLLNMPVKFQVAEEDVWLHGVFLEVDEASGKTLKIQRIQRSFL